MKLFKNKLTLSIIILATVLSCSGNKNKNANPFYILSNNKDIIEFEKSDHRFCTSINLTATSKKSKQNNLYWRCRLSLTKHRLKTDTSYQSSIDHNIKIGEIITKISLKLSKTPEIILNNANNDLDLFEHEKCQLMGYDAQTDDQNKIDEYFMCRKILIEDRNALPSFWQYEFMQYANNDYNLSYVIDQRLDFNINQYNKAKENYPNCIIHKISSQDFSNCTAAYDASRKCYLEIDAKKFNKEAQKKISCQRQANIRFPDEYIIKSKLNTNNVKARSDYYNNNDFSALGIDDISQFYNIKQKNKDTKNSKVKLISTKNELYSKFEIIKLREKYIKSCQLNADSEIAKYVDQLQKACKSLKKYQTK